MAGVAATTASSTSGRRGVGIGIDDSGDGVAAQLSAAANATPASSSSSSSSSSLAFVARERYLRAVGKGESGSAGGIVSSGADKTTTTTTTGRIGIGGSSVNVVFSASTKGTMRSTVAPFEVESTDAAATTTATRSKSSSWRLRIKKWTTACSSSSSSSSAANATKTTAATAAATLALGSSSAAAPRSKAGSSSSAAGAPLTKEEGDPELSQVITSNSDNALPKQPPPPSSKTVTATHASFLSPTLLVATPPARSAHVAATTPLPSLAALSSSESSVASSITRDSSRGSLGSLSASSSSSWGSPNWDRLLPSSAALASQQDLYEYHRRHRTSPTTLTLSPPRYWTPEAAERPPSPSATAARAPSSSLSPPTTTRSWHGSLSYTPSTHGDTDAEDDDNCGLGLSPLDLSPFATSPHHSHGRGHVVHHRHPHRAYGPHDGSSRMVEPPCGATNRATRDAPRTATPPGSASPTVTPTPRPTSGSRRPPRHHSSSSSSSSSSSTSPLFFSPPAPPKSLLVMSTAPTGCSGSNSSMRSCFETETLAPWTLPPLPSLTGQSLPFRRRECGPGAFKSRADQNSDRDKAGADPFVGCVRGRDREHAAESYLEDEDDENCGGGDNFGTAGCWVLRPPSAPFGGSSSHPNAPTRTAASGGGGGSVKK